MDGHAMGLLLALFAAMTTSWAHMMLKGGTDKLARRAWTGLTGLAGATPVAAFVPWPTASLWPWLLASCALHVVYQLVLIASYRSNDFGAAYPLARGVAPLLAGLGGIVVFAERPGTLALAGMALVSAGCLTIAGKGGLTLGGAALAGITGLLTSVYTVVDAGGVRAASVGLTFIAWFFILDGLVMPAIYRLSRGSEWRNGLRADWPGGVLSGIASLAGFGAALAALGLAPVGEVSALRETGVLFAILLARFWLGEAMPLRRVLGAVAIAAGAAAIII